MKICYFFIKPTGFSSSSLSGRGLLLSITLRVYLYHSCSLLSRRALQFRPKLVVYYSDLTLELQGSRPSSFPCFFLDEDTLPFLKPSGFNTFLFISVLGTKTHSWSSDISLEMESDPSPDRHTYSIYKPPGLTFPLYN